MVCALLVSLRATIASAYEMAVAKALPFTLRAAQWLRNIDVSDPATLLVLHRTEVDAFALGLRLRRENNLFVRYTFSTTFPAFQPVSFKRLSPPEFETRTIFFVPVSLIV